MRAHVLTGTMIAALAAAVVSQAKMATHTQDDAGLGTRNDIPDKSKSALATPVTSTLGLQVKEFLRASGHSESLIKVADQQQQQWPK